MINDEKRKIQMEALGALEKHNYKGIVILPTGTGKSYVLIEALKALYKPGMSVIYTCDSIRLRDHDFAKELEKWGAAEFSTIIEKECYASAYKFNGRHYNIALVDEGDYGLTPEYSKFFTQNTFDHIIFVSATLEPDKRGLAKNICPIVYEKKIKEIENQKVINKTQFHYVPYMLNKAEQAKYNEYNQKYRDLLRQSKTAYREMKLKFLSFERLHFLGSLDSSAYICKLLLKELFTTKPDTKALVFCTHTDQADRICESYHTKNADKGYLEAFNDGLITKLAVCGKIDRGVNINGVNTVIGESLTGSETKMIQKFGRGKRLDVDEVLDAYLLIPYYIHYSTNKMTPTIVLEKVQKACRNMGIENAKTLILKTS